jgi:ATP-dependent RNA circularization protein (DNA/RNA ligase family)
MEKIFENDLFASQHYFPLNLLFSEDNCPVWEKYQMNIINLFNDFRLKEEQALRICSIINEFGEQTQT